MKLRINAGKVWSTSEIEKCMKEWFENKVFKNINGNNSFYREYGIKTPEEISDKYGVFISIGTLGKITFAVENLENDRTEFRSRMVSNVEDAHRVLDHLIQVSMNEALLLEEMAQ